MSTTTYEHGIGNAEVSDLAAIRTRHPELFAEPNVTAFGFINADNARVEVSTEADRLSIRFCGKPGQHHQHILLDAPTAYALFQALDEAVEVCAACRQPGLKDHDLQRCAVVGDWLHDSDKACHRTACSSAECFE